MQINGKTWAAIAYTTALTVLTLCYPSLWYHNEHPPFSFTVGLVLVAVFLCLYFLWSQTPISRAATGLVFVSTSIGWFVGPYEAFANWFFNIRLAVSYFEPFFNGYDAPLDNAKMLHVGLNAFWFIIFALGVALIKSTPWAKLIASSSASPETYRSNSTLFGNARWGKWSEIGPHVEDPEGIVLGEDYDPLKSQRPFSAKDPRSWGKGGRAPLITMSTEFNGGHINVFSGTGGGKTAGIVFPTAFTYQHPIIVLDVAGEIYETVEPARAAMGFEARVIEPGSGINLIKMLEPYLRSQDKTFFTIAHTLVAPMKENTSDGGRYFTDEAAILAAGLLKYLHQKGETDLFGAFARIIAKNEVELKEYFKTAVENSPEGGFVQNFLGTYSQAESRTFTSLQSTTRQALIWAGIDKFGDILSAEPPNSPDALGPKTDLYIRLSMSDLESFPTIARQIFATLIFIIEEERGLGERLLIVDEAYQVGRLKQFEMVRDTMRKRRLHIMQIFQSEGQLEDLYGRAGAASWRSSVAATVYTSTENSDEQRRISQAIGSYTADVRSTSKGRSAKGFAFDASNVSQSDSSGLQGVPLLRPEEIRKLPNDAQVIFFKGQSPILCGKAFSWRRKEWQAHTPFMVNGKKVKLP